MLDAVFNPGMVVERGVDAAVYVVMAAAGTLLFLLRLAMALLGGDAGDGDLDLGHHDADAGFTFFSLLSVLAFFMGAGWMGLACRFDWQLGHLASALVSTGFGFATMTAASGLAWGMRRLNQEAHYDVATAIGRSGRVYLTVPARGQGSGQVEVDVSGQRKIMRAVSSGPALEAFTDVVVTAVDGGETLVVEAKYPRG